MLEVWWKIAKKMKIFIFLFLGLNLIFANAGIFDKKLGLRECRFDANDCNDCKKNGIEIDFLLNKKDKTVLKRIYYEGTITSSKVEENCKIFDEKNWDCSNDRGVGRLLFESKVKMINGIYYQTWKTINLNNFQTFDEKTVCAK